MTNGTYFCLISSQPLVKNDKLTTLSKLSDKKSYRSKLYCEVLRYKDAYRYRLQMKNVLNYILVDFSKLSIQALLEQAVYKDRCQYNFVHSSFSFSLFICPNWYLHHVNDHFVLFMKTPLRLNLRQINPVWHCTIIIIWRVHSLFFKYKLI